MKYEDSWKSWESVCISDGTSCKIINLEFIDFVVWKPSEIDE